MTFIEPDGSWPIVWQRAKGANVWDADGRKYLDLTAGFGVAAAGHANPRVVKAGQQQMARLLHAMGDVHPHPLKAELARELSRITFERWSSRAGSTSRLTGKTIFCNSGFEAVEAALKTAMLLTGKRGVVAFTGAYHGLGYGALNATHRSFFREPFLKQLGKFAQFLPFPEDEPEGGRGGLAAPSQPETGCPRPWVGDSSYVCSQLEVALRKLFGKSPIGAILVEPVQGRAGIRIPPSWFLPLLRSLSDEHEGLLIVDEVFTGFGRTGRWFACEHTGTIPDIICLGKALAGGFPISACVGKANLMDAAWPESGGEAIHTSTFLGHPVGCAMALAQIQELQKQNLMKISARNGKALLDALRSIRIPSSLRARARGLGLMAGLELSLPDGRPATSASLAIIKGMLQRGYILLPEGEKGNVISFTPPLVIDRDELLKAISVLEEVMHEAV